MNHCFIPECGSPDQPHSSRSYKFGGSKLELFRRRRSECLVCATLLGSKLWTPKWMQQCCWHDAAGYGWDGVWMALLIKNHSLTESNCALGIPQFAPLFDRISRFFDRHTVRQTVRQTARHTAGHTVTHMSLIPFTVCYPLVRPTIRVYKQRSLAKKSVY